MRNHESYEPYEWKEIVKSRAYPNLLEVREDLSFLLTESLRASQSFQSRPSTFGGPLQ